jgi:hypothetical protein
MGSDNEAESREEVEPRKTGLELAKLQLARVRSAWSRKSEAYGEFPTPKTLTAEDIAVEVEDYIAQVSAALGEVPP